ncbi:MAG: nitrilase-related carbon-nitrogen hydrolase [Pseudomonadota bacterium]
MRDFRLSAAMMRSVVGDKSGNLERVESLAARAARQGARLLVLPEACLTGYTVRTSMAPWAEPLPGPLTRAVIDISSRHNLFILAGLVERADSGPLHLTQFLAGPAGLVGAHRKTHLGPTEKTLFEPGRELSIMEAEGIRFGVQLCYEGHFPEVSLTQALLGAEVLLIPHASPRETPREKTARWLRYLPARAYDNSVYLAACNQAGDNGAGLSFAGVALITGPKGELLAQALGNEDDLVVADLREDALTQVREGRMGFFLPERKPGMYRTD